jgi:hypothetical protein
MQPALPAPCLPPALAPHTPPSFARARLAPRFLQHYMRDLSSAFLRVYRDTSVGSVCINGEEEVSAAWLRLQAPLASQLGCLGAQRVRACRTGL